MRGSDKTGSPTTQRTDDARIAATSPPPAEQRRKEKQEAQSLGGGRGSVWPPEAKGHRRNKNQRPHLAAANTVQTALESLETRNWGSGSRPGPGRPTVRGTRVTRDSAGHRHLLPSEH